MQTSSENELETSTFKYGYEDTDVIKHTTAGQVILSASSQLLCSYVEDIQAVPKTKLF